MTISPYLLCAGNCFSKASSSELAVAKGSRSACWRIDGGVHLRWVDATINLRARALDTLGYSGPPPCTLHLRSAVNFWGQMGSNTFVFFDSSEREAHPPHPRCGLRALELELRRSARPPAASLAHTWHLLGLQMPLYAPLRSRCLQA